MKGVFSPGEEGECEVVSDTEPIPDQATNGIKGKSKGGKPCLEGYHCLLWSIQSAEPVICSHGTQGDLVITNKE